MLGRKRHFAVDTQGNLVRVWVHAADLSDQAAAAWWIDQLVAACPTLHHVFADAAYRGDWIAWVHSTSEVMWVGIQPGAPTTMPS